MSAYPRPSFGEGTPQLHRDDCLASDDCCLLSTRTYFDRVPSHIWDHQGDYPIESFGVNFLNNFGRYGHYKRNRGLALKYTKSSACTHRCRDISVGLKPDDLNLRKLPWNFSFDCPPGMFIATYLASSRSPRSAARDTRCRCVDPMKSKFQSRQRSISSAELRLWLTKTGIVATSAVIARGKADCVDSGPYNDPIAKYEVDKWDMNLMAVTSPLLDWLPEISLDAAHLASASVSSLSDIAWTEITDVTQQQTIHQVGASAQMLSTDSSHEFRACAVAPEVAEARLLIMTFWTPI